MIALPDKLTPLEPIDAIDAVWQALLFVECRPPSAAALLCHVAQCAYETGHFGKGWGGEMHWYNFGNERPPSGFTGEVTHFGCSETIRGVSHYYHPIAERAWPGEETWLARHPDSVANDHATCFRAYRTPVLGALAHMQLLAGRERYAAAWAAAWTGDLAGFARALKAGGYYTDSLMHYTATMTSVARRYQRRCEEYINDHPPSD